VLRTEPFRPLSSTVATLKSILSRCALLNCEMLRMLLANRTAAVLKLQLDE
jgi:hypothetical protein